jgi:hypothetical protein
MASMDGHMWKVADSVSSVSRRRKHLPRARCPRRLDPVDHRERCFNRFSTDHRAGGCPSRTRCFWCRALGHHASECICQPPTRRTGVPLCLLWRLNPACRALRLPMCAHRLSRTFQAGRLGTVGVDSEGPRPVPEVMPLPATLLTVAPTRGSLWPQAALRLLRVVLPV